MMKRLYRALCAVLIVVMLLPTLAISLAAADAVSEVTVAVKRKPQNERYKLKMIQKNGEVYIHAEDIPKISGYKQVKDPANPDMIGYNAGKKTVFFSQSSDLVTFGKVRGTYGGSIKHNGALYLSFAGVLPWLDTSIEDPGIWNIADDISLYTSDNFYKIVSDFSCESTLLEDYIGGSDGGNKWAIIGAFMMDSIINPLETAKNLFIAGATANEEYYYKDAYEGVFEDLIKNEVLAEVLACDDGVEDGTKSLLSFMEEIGIDMDKGGDIENITEVMKRYNLSDEMRPVIEQTVVELQGLNTAGKVVKWISPAIESFALISGSLKTTYYVRHGLKLLSERESSSLCAKTAKKTYKNSGDFFRTLSDKYINLLFETVLEFGLDKINPAMTALEISKIITSIFVGDEMKAIGELAYISVYGDVLNKAGEVVRVNRPQSFVNKVQQEECFSAMTIYALARIRWLNALKAWMYGNGDSTKKISSEISQYEDLLKRIKNCKLDTETYLTELSDDGDSKTNWEKQYIANKDIIGAYVEHQRAMQIFENFCRIIPERFGEFDSFQHIELIDLLRYFGSFTDTNVDHSLTFLNHETGVDTTVYSVEKMNQRSLQLFNKTPDWSKISRYNEVNGPESITYTFNKGKGTIECKSVYSTNNAYGGGGTNEWHYTTEYAFTYFKTADFKNYEVHYEVQEYKYFLDNDYNKTNRQFVRVVRKAVIGVEKIGDEYYIHSHHYLD